MQRDLFPWFREHGIEVDRSKSPIVYEDVRALNPETETRKDG